MMEISITDRILYTQILTKAGFTIRAMTGIVPTRDNGVVLRGEFTDGNRPGAGLSEVDIGTRAHGIDPSLVLEGATVGIIVINGLDHYVNMRPSGSFDLAVAL